MQCRQRTTRHQRRDKSADAQRVVHLRDGLLCLLLAVQHPAEIEDHNRKQVGWPAEEIEQQVRCIGAQAPHPVGDFRRTGRLAEPRIVDVVREQRVPEDQGQRAKYIERTFT